ncbi:MAG TPA: hypothetical protein VND19_17185 [Acetobacteraceae bacterium]|nr:hypothetical protein [Acetobacteraceae bacterium]
MSAPRVGLKHDGGSHRVVKARRAAGPNDTFEMACLYPRDTGLPMTIWVSPRGNARHDARIRVCLTPGDRMDAGNPTVVAIRPVPRLMRGALPARDFARVARWVADNTAALLGYWDGSLSTVEFVTRMRRLPRAGAAGVAEA